MPEEESILSEEKAVPEWWIVKREILWSCYEATKCLAMYKRGRERGSLDIVSLIDFKKYVTELYLKLRTKIDKNDKTYGSLHKLDRYIMYGDKVQVPEWIKYFFLLQDFLEDRLGITKIERKRLPPDRAILEGAMV